MRWGELWNFTAKAKTDFALRSAAYSPRGAVNSDKVLFWCNYMTKSEPILSEADRFAPPRRRAAKRHCLAEKCTLQFS